MEVQLKVMVGGNAGQVIRVPGPKFFIGRADDCQLRPGSDLISRHHCVLMIEGHSIVVRDFASKNGTIVNGERISGEVELQNGDVLKLGPLEFELSVVESIAGAKRPKVTSIKEAAARISESGVHGDLDVGEWLKTGAADSADTREIDRHETTELETTATITVPAPAPPPPSRAEEPTIDTAAEQQMQKTMTEKRAPGKLPPIPKKDSDSHSAAADMLKKLRRW